MQVAFGRVRRKTEPTGPGEDMELRAVVNYQSLNGNIRVSVAMP